MFVHYHGISTRPFILASSDFVQTPSPSLHGQVLDSSGAAVPAISVEVPAPPGTNWWRKRTIKVSIHFATWRRKLYGCHSPAGIQ